MGRPPATAAGGRCWGRTPPRCWPRSPGPPGPPRRRRKQPEGAAHVHCKSRSTDGLRVALAWAAARWKISSAAAKPAWPADRGSSVRRTRWKPVEAVLPPLQGPAGAAVHRVYPGGAGSAPAPARASPVTPADRPPGGSSPAPPVRPLQLRPPARPPLPPRYCSGEPRSNQGASGPRTGITGRPLSEQPGDPLRHIHRPRVRQTGQGARIDGVDAQPQPRYPFRLFVVRHHPLPFDLQHAEVQPLPPQLGRHRQPPARGCDERR